MRCILNNEEQTFASSLSFPDVARFARRATPLLQPPRGWLTVGDEFRIYLRLLRAARKEKVMLLNSACGRFHPDLFVAASLGFLPHSKRPIIVLGGEMWQPNTGIRRWIETLVVRLADRAINLYAVQSSDELDVFPETWALPRGKTRFCPYYYSLTREKGDDEMLKANIKPRRHIFSGGNSHRDYEHLIEAARQLPELEFVLATRCLDGRIDLPPNVKAGAVSHKEFVELMIASSVVIVPMKKGLRRAVGQQTYLNAMWLGKPTIVNDVLGVRDYIQNKETGFVVDGSVAKYVNTIEWILDSANRQEIDLLTKNAQKVVREKFSATEHAHRLLEIVDEAISMT